MGASQPKPVRVCKDVLWSRPSVRTCYPTADEIEQCLLNTDCTALLGKDVCRIIASYCPCLLDSAFVTSNGHVVPVPPSTSSPSLSLLCVASTAQPRPSTTTQSAIRVRPRLPCQSTCFVPLPPSSMAFGLADVAPLNPGESRRAQVSIYHAHSFTHIRSIHFPQQSSFLTTNPSVSSLLLLPKADAQPGSYSSLLAGIDDLGHLCVWRWTTGELIYLFDCKPPVFFSLSSMCALPNARLALLLSGCPGSAHSIPFEGVHSQLSLLSLLISHLVCSLWLHFCLLSPRPQHPASRTLVFDLSTGSMYKSAVDSDNQSEQVFPLSLHFPPQHATPATPAHSPTRVRSSPYSLYSNDCLYRWHVDSSRHTVELHTATPHQPPQSQQQPSDVWQCMGQSQQSSYGYKWRHKTECVRWDRDGRVVRVEGGVGVVKVWIGHHADRAYRGKWEFEDAGYEKQEVETDGAESKSDSEGDETEAAEEEKEAKRPQAHSLSSTISVATDDDSKAAAAAGLDSTDEDELPTNSTSTATASPLSIIARTAPVLIPRVVPLPLLLPAPVLFRRRHRHRRRPALLHVSASFIQPSSGAGAPLLVIASSAPLQHGSGGGSAGSRLVSVWRLVEDGGSGEVSGECVERRRYGVEGGEEWSVLCNDAAAKVAQRMKGPKQWLLG